MNLIHYQYKAAHANSYRKSLLDSGTKIWGEGWPITFEVLRKVMVGVHDLQTEEDKEDGEQVLYRSAIFR